MNQKKYSTYLFFIICLAFSFKSDNSLYPEDYFRVPVDFTPRLSGTFGELRPNHFHSGIDIKSSRGKIGDKLYAAAEGYISRIKIQSGGYGKALYIDHPNGYTTVYAHLHEFTPEVERYVKAMQYEKQSFSLDIQLPMGRFSFKKGEVIGKMGNTGRSFGPHLHFEIRNTTTEEPINPLLFGIKVKDNIPPKLHQIRVYPLSNQHETLEPFTKDIKKSKYGKYYVGGDTLSIDGWRTGLGIKAYDHMNGSHNWNGVYAIETRVNGKLIHQTTFEKFHFKDTRYLNTHIDYREKILKKAWFNRCYRTAGNHLPMYPVLENDGVIELSSKAKEVEIRVRDINGNSSSVRFWVKKSPQISTPKDKYYNYFLPYSEPNSIQRKNMFMDIPLGALYENLYLKLNSTPDGSEGVYSSTIQIQDKKTPLHKWVKLGIKPHNIPAEKREKAIIVRCEKGKENVSHGGEWQGDMLVADIRDFGKYCVMIDDQPPVITPLIFKKNLKGYNKIQFKLKDNFKTSKKLNDYKWNGYIDNEWVLFQPNANENIITHRFDKNLTAGLHILRLELTDERGNKTVFEKEFTR